MRKFQCLLFVLKRSYICYYIICMTVKVLVGVSLVFSTINKVNTDEALILIKRLEKVQHIDNAPRQQTDGSSQCRTGRYTLIDIKYDCFLYYQMSKYLKLNIHEDILYHMRNVFNYFCYWRFFRIVYTSIYFFNQRFKVS